MVNTVPDPELEMGGGGGGGGEWAAVIQTLRKGGAVSEKCFSTVGHQNGLKIRGAGSPDPSPGSATAIMRGRIIMAMRTVYVEYGKLPLTSSPTFKPFPPLMSPATRKQKNTSNTEIQICDPYCFWRIYKLISITGWVNEYSRTGFQ